VAAAQHAATTSTVARGALVYRLAHATRKAISPERKRTSAQVAWQARSSGMTHSPNNREEQAAIRTGPPHVCAGGDTARQRRGTCTLQVFLPARCGYNCGPFVPLEF